MKAAGVRRLVHVGAMGVVDDPSLHYASSKAKAEALVAASGLEWTILKPSLQFGQGDGFFNIIADLARLSPGVIPVPGSGDSRFQPIHVGDVAKVAVAAFADPTTAGGAFELGGALLDLPRDRARSSRPWTSAAIVDARPDNPAGSRERRGAADPVPGRHRPDPQLRSTTSGARRLRHASGSRRGRWKGSAISAKSRDQRTRGDVFAGAVTGGGLATGDGVAPA
jgi:uncharacterized protein YbjT (DUF2867 family)